MREKLGVWRYLVREVTRQIADAAHLELTVQHSGDVKDLEERLRYAAHPEEAYWNRSPTPEAEIERTLAGIRRP